MRRRLFGATGLEVTPIGLGLAALGRPGYLNLGHGDDLAGAQAVDALRARAFEVLDAAHAAGIGYLDVARSYGRGESFLGSWLTGRGLPVGAVTVGSKWGYTYTADWQVDAEQHEVKDHTLPTFERQLTQTRHHLGDRLDLYQIHSATLDSGVLDDPAVLRALFALRDQGVVIGLSLSGPGQTATLRRALELTARGAAPFAAVQATYNLLEPSVGPTLLAAAEAGWGVIIKEALANGRLTDRAPVPAALRAMAEQRGVGVDALALAAALAHPAASVVLSGAATTAQLTSNLTAVDVEVAPDEAARLAALAEPPEAYWSTRSGLVWT